MTLDEIRLNKQQTDKRRSTSSDRDNSHLSTLCSEELKIHTSKPDKPNIKSIFPLQSTMKMDSGRMQNVKDHHDALHPFESLTILGILFLVSSIVAL